MVTTVQIPLAILATGGGYMLLRNMRKYLSAFFISSVCVLLFLILNISNIYVFSEFFFRYTNEDLRTNYYISDAYYDAGKWLKTYDDGNDGVVLSHPVTGIHLPGYTTLPIYCCHFGQTVAREDKEIGTGNWWSFDGEYDILEKEAFLSREHISYILYGEREKQEYGDIPFDDLPFLSKIYSTSGTTVYEYKQ
jgi:hypothetical protein